MEPRKSELALARAALRTAHSRFARDVDNRDAVAWYSSLGETLWWIVALDEHYRNQRKQAAYLKLLKSDEDGYVIPGLRLARNRIGHGLALMLEGPDGRSPFSTPPPARVTLKTVQWRRLEDLPAVSSSIAETEKNMRPVYHDHLEGNPVRFALRHARRFFVQRHSAIDAAIR
jgi:hypothetical protein